MVEVTVSYHRLPDTDEDEYWGFLKNRLPTLFSAPGLKGIEAHHDLRDPGLVRIKLVWESEDAWNRFSVTDAWRALMDEARIYGDRFEEHVWVASEYVPDPIRLSGRPAGD